jgi:hypothetical protein
MAIIDDFDAIAKRMRELKAPAPKDATSITEMERWRDAAMETARVYVQNRRRGLAGGPSLPRRPQPRD